MDAAANMIRGRRISRVGVQLDAAKLKPFSVDTLTSCSHLSLQESEGKSLAGELPLRSRCLEGEEEAL